MVNLKAIFRETIRSIENNESVQRRIGDKDKM